MNKKVIFLAGTTSWDSDLLYTSWRRKFLEKINQEPNMEGVEVCILEPQFDVFNQRYERPLIEWENEYLNKLTMHAYWLNTYWT